MRVGERFSIDLAPQFITLDFERAAIKAFSATFPHLRVRGCHFHFCQSILRQVNSLGLKVTYEENEEFRTCVRMLMVLPYMEIVELVAGYTQLKPIFPDTGQPLLAYFEV